jgi:fluoride exporter
LKEGEVPMKKYIYIGVGGFLGAISRYLVKGIELFQYQGAIPYNTLLINVSGSIVLALLLTISFEIWEMDENMRLGLATGFLGAFTTFSTMCKETAQLIKTGDIFSALAYISLSTILGLAGVYLGVILARKVIAKIVRRKNTNAT